MLIALRLTLIFSPGWSVCLDAAAWVSSSPLDLSQYRPDFVVFSFYKLFGYPTGLGALLVRNGECIFEILLITFPRQCS